MPHEITRKRYSMNPKEDSKEEEELTYETKQNNAILMEWETQFIDDFGDDMGSGDKTKKHCRSRTSRSNSIRRQHRNNRRTSSIFSPSPLSMEDDDDSGDDTSSCSSSTVETQQRPSLEHTSATAASPSLVVAQNLASLRVSDGSPEDFSACEVSERNASYHFVASPAPGGDNTWEFAVNLGLLHATGGAMEVSPLPSRPSTTLSTSVNSAGSKLCEENTPPPTDVNMESIHSVGGALDGDDELATPNKENRNVVESPQMSFLESVSTKPVLIILVLPPSKKGIVWSIIYSICVALSDDKFFHLTISLSERNLAVSNSLTT
jgi:hypothetical protein